MRRRSKRMTSCNGSYRGSRFAPTWIKQHCRQLADRLARGEAVTLIAESAGMGFGWASEWYREKYGREASRTPWRKAQLSIDPDMNIHAIAIAITESDQAGLDTVLAVDASVDCVIADGAHYSLAQTEVWSSCGVLPVIPPPANAVVHEQPTTRWHDQLVKYIQDKGIYALHKRFGYGKRALVAAQSSRIKRCIGARLLTRKTESRQCEGASSPTS